jgi:hypothetical protein
LSANQQIGFRLASSYGWGTAGEWGALNKLWTKESDWNNIARNKSSGAYGIAQALPPTKMPAAAQAGDATTQIAWGLGYIKDRYGSPANAWKHEVAKNWY